MSEAYEIGVELADQDELSGGLEIIFQEFASLDAAIAASNAGFLALMEESGTRAVAEVPYRTTAGAAPEVQAARGSPLSSVETSGAGPFGSNNRETAAAPTTSYFGRLSEAAVGAVVAPGVASGLESTVRRNIVTSRLMAPRGILAGPSGRGIDVAPVANSAVAATVPAQSSLGITREQTAFAGAAASPEGWGERPGVPPLTAETELPGRAVAPVRDDHPIDVAEPDPAQVEGAVSRGEAVAPPRDVSLRRLEKVASWPSYAVAPLAEGAPGGSAGAVLPFGEARLPLPDRSEAPAGERSGRRRFEAAMAPRMAREQVSGAPGGMFSERSAAPQGDAGARQDDGKAVVMLDGRLVGEMLSGRMARDAARPGAGITSFDARQAPAWTPSGAL